MSLSLQLLRRAVVFRSQTHMQHIPFLRAIASTNSAAETRWKALTAGYLALRFLDYWKEDPSLAQHSKVVMVIRQRIFEDVSVEQKLYGVLRSVVDAIASSSHNNPVEISESLLVYANFLESCGDLLLADHVNMVVRSLPAQPALPQSSTFDRPFENVADLQ